MHLKNKNKKLAEQWWRTALIPALGRQRQVDLCEFNSTWSTKPSSRTGSKDTQRSPVLGKKKKPHLTAIGCLKVVAKVMLSSCEAASVHWLVNQHLSLRSWKNKLAIAKVIQCSLRYACRVCCPPSEGCYCCEAQWPKQHFHITLHRQRKSGHDPEGRSWCKGHGGELLADPLTCSALFLTEPNTTSPEVSLPQWARPSHITKKMPTVVVLNLWVTTPLANGCLQKYLHCSS